MRKTRALKNLRPKSSQSKAKKCHECKRRGKIIDNLTQRIFASDAAYRAEHYSFEASRALYIEATKRNVELTMALQKLMASQTPDLRGERLIPASEIGKLIQ